MWCHCGMQIKAKGGEGVDIYSGFHVPEEEANQGKYVPLHILCPVPNPEWGRRELHVVMPVLVTSC